MNNRSLLTLKDVTKVYQTDEVETRALDRLNLEISEGEYVSICGPSGCGKSTLLTVLGLLDRPTSGRYTISGVDVSDIDRRELTRVRNKEIGIVFQAFNLIGDISVLENVALPLTYRPGVTKAEAMDRASQALQSVGMSARSAHMPGQLSGGQQQRVAVARAVVGAPSLLLADEPTGNLDSRNGDAVMELLGELNSRGTTICMVTHDVKHAARAKRQIHMLDGQVMVPG